MLELRGIVNFRDVGGHETRRGGRVRTGRVFRSGHLAGATPEDLEALTRLGIRTVIDLRTGSDMEGDGGHRLPAGASRLHLPMGDPARAATDIRDLLFGSDRERMAARLGGGQAVQMMTESAAARVPERRPAYGEMVRCLARKESLPAVVHCSAGKDRTGWAASLLLLAVDVPEEAVIAHYVESEHHRRDETRRALEGMPEGVEHDWVRPFFECRPEYARASIDAMRSGWGDVDGYLTRGLGVTPGEVERLRALLLD